MNSEFALYLASQSPRRRELLSQVGISFELLSVDVDESVNINETVKEYVVRLAKEKAIAGWNMNKTNSTPVLGSDTSVVINNEILGKPANTIEAKKMLALLSGKTHQVMTAVALAMPSEGVMQAELACVLSVSDVSFKKLSSDEIELYIATGESADKAGAYAIQGRAAAFITHLSGSYSGVMGLPLFETIELLKNAGIRADSLVVS